MISQPIYQLRTQDALQALETSAEGLPSAEVLARQELYGKNILRNEERPAQWKHFARHIVHPFSLLLMFSAGVAFAIRQPVLGIVIGMIVLVNSTFSFWREYRAEQAMQALRRLLPTYARVIRDGEEKSVLAEEIVPGDLLVLAEGDFVPADARVIEQYGLRVSNATLTGEAVPARKTADASFQAEMSELDRPNLIFAGTSIVSGTCRAIVYATGMLTQFGRVAYLTQSAKEEPSPLQVELLQLTRKIAMIAIFISLLTIVIGFFDVGLTLFDAFLLALGILVAAIPEGLPANVTLSLAMAGQRLANQGVLVKRLGAIEILGSISVICTDKSGTLTQNQMTVREIWVGGKKLSVSGAGYDPLGEIYPKNLSPALNSDLELLLIAGMLCNNSRLCAPGEGKPQWTSLGDQTEAALRVVALKAGLDEQAVVHRYPRVHELPFDAQRKRMSTIHRRLNGTYTKSANPELFNRFPAGRDSREVAFVKGSPREVLALCSRIYLGGQILPLDERLRKQIHVATDEYASQALRVLALAYRELPPRTGAYRANQVENELTFLGLMAMHDPPRPEVEKAVGICKEAGVRIVMITGDYGLTAVALARKVGLLDSTSARVVTGAELEGLDETGLQRALDQEVVFARMAPEHKLRLVAAFQAAGEVVAVTGDGVNDAPALRKADIGVAMGIAGTDVAKEASDIILTDDNFAHLVSAIEEGRAVYANLRKFITYIFSSNIPEILPFLLTALVNFPLALTVRQILAIDLGTDMLPGLALGVEPPEPGLMQHPPRRRTERLIDRSLLRRAFLWLGPLEALLAYSGFFLVYALFSGTITLSYLEWGWAGSLIQKLVEGSKPENVHMMAVTVFHAGVVMAQIGNAFACRTATQRGRTLGWFKNPTLWLAVLVETLLILALIYVPPLARAFDHVPLPPWIWIWLVLYPPVLYGFEWIRKQIAGKISARWVTWQNRTSECE